MGDSRRPEALLEEICRLAEGPAGPVLKEGVGKWLSQEDRAIRHAVEQKKKWLPTSPFPLNEHNATFPGACAALAVLHEKTEPFYLLRPDLRHGSYRHFAWEMLCKDLDDLEPRHIRNLLSYVRAELQKRGVAFPSEEESTSAEDNVTLSDEQDPTGDASAAVRLLNVYTNGLADDRLEKASSVLNSDLTVDEKLWKIDELMPIPPTVSAEKLGKIFTSGEKPNGVSKTAIQNTTWYDQKRKGRKSKEIDKREGRLRQLGQEYKRDRQADDDD